MVKYQAKAQRSKRTVQDAGVQDAKEEKCRKYAPEQRGFNGPKGIPIILYEIHGGVRAFKQLMRRRWRRARKIASILIGRHQVPATPLLNPVTKRSSCHIIKLVDKKKPGYSVDLLVLDCNAYLVAFRRQQLDEHGNWFGDGWYKYSDVKNEELPPEISKHAVSLKFNSSHKDGSYATPGGVSQMRNIFEILSKFEDCARTRAGKLLNEEDSNKVEGALLKAIVMFCESLRFRSIYLLMLKRAWDNQDESTLDPTSWKLIHDWDHGSMEVQDFWNKELPPMYTPLPSWFHGVKVYRPGTDPVNLTTLEDLIGEDGELMLLNAHEELIISKEEQKDMDKFLNKNTTLPVREPGFD